MKRCIQYGDIIKLFSFFLFFLFLFFSVKLKFKGNKEGGENYWRQIRNARQRDSEKDGRAVNGRRRQGGGSGSSNNVTIYVSPPKPNRYLLIKINIYIYIVKSIYLSIMFYII